MASVASEPNRLGHFACHHRLATPVSPWERLKIGGGTPPIMTRHGWLIVYHGVSEVVEPSNGGHHLCYSAGVMVLSKEHPIAFSISEPSFSIPEDRRTLLLLCLKSSELPRSNRVGVDPQPLLLPRAVSSNRARLRSLE